MMFPPSKRFCHKCGAEPGLPCRTKGGNRTTFHRARKHTGSAGEIQNATKYECWKMGYKYGVSSALAAPALMGVASSDLAKTLLYPEAFIAGFEAGKKSANRDFERARKKYMQ